MNIVLREALVLFKNFSDRCTMSQQIEDALNGKAGSPNNSLTDHNIGIDRNPLKELLISHDFCFSPNKFEWLTFNTLVLEPYPFLFWQSAPAGFWPETQSF
jgi:hypothetical protein